MNTQKRKRLEEKGQKFGTIKEFLNLSPEENNYIEVKVALSKGLQKFRKDKKATQAQLAKMLASSQSRVAKMEKGDPSVSIDLLVRSLFTLGMSKKYLAQILLK